MDHFHIIIVRGSNQSKTNELYNKISGVEWVDLLESFEEKDDDDDDILFIPTIQTHLL